MSNIYEMARRGVPLKGCFTIIDCHCHMGYWHNFHVPKGSPEEMLASMDSLGIDMACLTHHSSIGPDYRYGNDKIREAIEKYPKRFVGYVTLNPNYPEDMKNEIGRCFSIRGFKGIKLHPASHGSPIDHKNYHPAYEAANQKHCPILIHVWGQNEVAIVDTLAYEYPEANFIMGHTGGEEKAMEYAVQVINRHDNVFADLTVSVVREGNVEWFVNEIGSHKTLFGSDMPFIDPRSALGRVALAQINEQEKIDILGGNMSRLLGIVE